MSDSPQPAPARAFAIVHPCGDYELVSTQVKNEAECWELFNEESLLGKYLPEQWKELGFTCREVQITAQPVGAGQESPLVAMGLLPSADAIGALADKMEAAEEAGANFLLSDVDGELSTAIAALRTAACHIAMLALRTPEAGKGEE